MDKDEVTLLFIALGILGWGLVFPELTALFSSLAILILILVIITK